MFAYTFCLTGETVSNIHINGQSTRRHIHIRDPLRVSCVQIPSPGMKQQQKLAKCHPLNKLRVVGNHKNRINNSITDNPADNVKRINIECGTHSANAERPSNWKWTLLLDGVMPLQLMDGNRKLLSYYTSVVWRTHIRIVWRFRLVCYGQSCWCRVRAHNEHFFFSFRQT